MLYENIHLAAMVAVMLLITGTARAKDLFQLDASVNPNSTNPTTGSIHLNDITQLIDQLQTQNLNNLVNSYNQNSAAVVNLNFRGLPASASYNQNSPALRFTVPAAGVDITFNGTTRDDSQKQLKDFLLRNGSGIATKILQALVAASPVDPVAGNPNALQNLSARSDFTIGTGIGLGGAEIPGSRGGAKGGLAGQPNLFALGGDVGFARSGGFTSTIVNLPIRYSIPFSDPRFAVTLDTPLTYVNTQGSASYMGSFGLSLRIPLLENWYISPSLRFGAVGSSGLGAASVQYSGGLASRYDIFFSDLQLTIGNAVTVVKTAGLSFREVNVNYDLTNELFTNGVQLEGSLPYTIFGQPTSWQVWLADTHVTGSKVYINHYDEIGFTVGTRHSMNTQNWDSLRVGLVATVGARYTAVKAAFSYRF